ncbi:hypothetical protein PTSG_09592 [Salpingoeca rosetta]|uniref:Uncharacterized protein n=1 Tax=Salpingoeca rosetta (strain ATCC 50818 / BSB-021) TaxID=946362 RepID=F2ULF9_SALR5|nr:uncharacterized protein PTSG_09592 [Salpingoeca rosetta]EGD77958.1 hypothetical protein PTSG_09592 [Salpingoeca rosetta]|eukprot:XP_004990021.1 hypothetical protein PTSG_09592 [Salpingoeca rosetta]
MDRSDIDALVLDYLVHEGYKTAAEKMVEEASLSPPTELDHVDDRMKKQRQDVKLTRVLKLLMWLEKQLATKLEVETLDWMGPSKPSSASSASPQTKPDNGDSKPTS